MHLLAACRGNVSWLRKCSTHQDLHLLLKKLGESVDRMTSRDTKEYVSDFLQNHPPDLLVVSPPCTHEGGWFHLNASKLPMKVRLELIRTSRGFVKFAVSLMRTQLQHGGQVLLEHPLGSKIWKYPEVQALLKDFPECKLIKCHMCRFGLRVPGDQRLIRKATRLLVSGEDACHQCHLPVAGSHPAVGRVSTFAGQYTPSFSQAVLQTVPSYSQAMAEQRVHCEPFTSRDVQEALMVKADLNQGSESDIMKVIDKVHRNLGHPPSEDLVRILRHAHASDLAVSLARKHSCELCKAQQRPHVPLPSKANRPSSFNHVIGIDVKHLPGWKPNQKIRALNIICHGSCYQLMIPFFERETSDVLQKLLANYWVRVFGPPQEVIMDQARTNLGEPLQKYLENLGVYVRPIPGEAHWQLGRTETHGGWFARILEKTMQSQMPTDRETWEQCVLHSHVKNSMIQFYGYTPHQYVFGKNPNIPQDLLDEPIGVVPATASLSDDMVAKAQALRFSALRAVLETQDDQALRRALAARPRKLIQFEPGDLVAYWRAQKYTQEGVVQGGRWWGTAVVLGAVGKNYLVVHRRQIFRCAPEQLRPATNEEKTLVRTPQAELLGIRDMIEGDTFRSSQYVDLVPGSYPASADQETQPRVCSEERDHSPASLSAEKAPEESTGQPESPEEDPRLIDKSPMPKQPPDEPMEDVMKSFSQDVPHTSSSSASASRPSVVMPSPPGNTYGPVRRRVEGKTVGSALYRPAPMKEEDFVDMMREVVPTLLETSTSQVSKRSSDVAELQSEEPPTNRPRSEYEQHEALSVQDVTELTDAWQDPRVPVEVLIAQYMEKKLSKEVGHSGHPPDIQRELDASKTTEWQTLIEKKVIRIHYGKKAARTSRPIHRLKIRHHS